MTCSLSLDMPKSSVKLDVSADRLEVRLAGSVLLQGHFLEQVEQDSWTWTLDGGKLGIMMTKKTPGREENMNQIF